MTAVCPTRYTAGMLPQELIRRKRDGAAFSADQIAALVAGITDGSLADSQIGALAMALFLRGLDEAETASLTACMARSGTVLRWDDPRPVVDKHSTGGVGGQTKPDAGPDRRRLRRSGADAGRTRAGPHRRHHRQAGGNSRLQRHPRPGALPAGGARCGLRHYRPDRRTRPRRWPAVCDPRRDRHGGACAADHRLDPVEEARRRGAESGDGCEMRLRRLSARPRAGGCAGGVVARGRRRSRASASRHC